MISIKNDYIFTFLNKIITISLGVVSSILITRYAGATLNGEYAIITNTLNIYALFANLGIYQAYPKYKRSQYPDILKKIVNLFYLQFLVLSLISLVFILSNIQVFVFFLLPLVVLSNQLNFIVMVEDVYYKNKMNIISSVLKLLYSIFIFLFCKRSIFFLLGTLVIVEIFLDFVYLFKLKIKIDFTCLSFDFIFDLLKYSIIPMFSSLLMMLNYRFDIIMLDLLNIDKFMIGQYSLAVTLAGYAWLVPDIFKEVLFSRTAKSDSFEEINFCLKLSNLACFIMILCIAIFGYYAILLLFGSEFTYSYPVTMILFLGVPSMAWFKIISTLYLAQGKRMFYFYTLLVSVIVNVGLNYIFIPIYSIYGAAISSVFSYSICGGVFLLNYCKNYNVPFANLFVFNRNIIKETYTFFSKKN